MTNSKKTNSPQQKQNTINQPHELGLGTIVHACDDIASDKKVGDTTQDKTKTNSPQTPQLHSYREKEKDRKVSEKAVASRIGENGLSDGDTTQDKTKTYLQLCEDAVKGCGREIKRYKDGVVLYCKESVPCPQCISKIQALKESGKSFLEFLKKFYGEDFCFNSSYNKFEEQYPL
ncbi:MAG: hypothetical protein WC346_09160 [Methanogenium sp.]|jgi:hypothetical protein